MQERGLAARSNVGSAVLVDKNLDAQALADVMDKCEELRREGRVTLVKRIKNFGFQLKQLSEQGYAAIYEIKDGQLKPVN